MANESMYISRISASSTIQSFFLLLVGRKVFQSFLRCEISEENILFWFACEELKEELIPQLVEKKAKTIYEDFVSIHSLREVFLITLFIQTRLPSW